MSNKQKSIITLIVIIPAAMLAGWTLQLLWGWFICPLGVAPISLAQGIGIDLLVTFLTGKVWQGKIQKEKLFRRWMQGSLVHPWVYLGIGYLVNCLYVRGF